ncbi:hypothetical protein P12x_005048 [Tundrisphaera lichenicola]|uniref:hypothetical protein n=1 Tax=Tundrisphaera lichenicola TaxID=2029860 RepID=UPI003EBDC4A5
MAKCDYCNAMILFGGVKQDQWRFCNDTCHQGAVLLHSASRIPDEVVARTLKNVHEGNCPKCAGPGPVDIHVSHSIWSALALTRWSSKASLCCQSCGNKARLGSAASSMFLGWWGFPWGLIMTPIQISRNIHGFVFPPDPLTPSDQLDKHVRILLASQSGQQKPSMN